MIELDLVQGSVEWRAARAGIPTASQFGRIVTPGGKWSKQADAYMYELAAEWFIGEPIESASTGYMERGNLLEPDAARAYEGLINWEMGLGLRIRKCGLCLTDDRTAGASPDRFVGDDGLLDVKCPRITTMVEACCQGVEEDGGAYRPQIQGQLYITGRRWVDLFFWNPLTTPERVRVERDEEYIDYLSGALKEFNRGLESVKTRVGNRWRGAAQ